MRSVIWNPWHGCEKYSEGCMNCYVYRRDGSVGRDASQVLRTNAFYLPRQKTRDGSYKVPSGSLVYCCMTSDLFLHLADAWRPEIWDMIRERGDLYFVIITKRIERAYKCLPTDWGDGWDNVELMCTAENQRVCDIRLPIFAAFPAKSRSVICEPLLGPIDMSRYLGRHIRRVVVGGESGPGARVCDFDWVKDIRRQCDEAGVPFTFKQTGALFRKDGRLYRIERRCQHSQAKKAGLDT